jgi:CBS domain containing-hemolysin-like protein
MFLTLLSVIFVVGILVGLNALYVAGEFASVSARRTRITQLAMEGNRLAKVVLPVLEDHHKLDNYIAASQVGITLSSIMLGIYGQRQLAPRIEPWLAGLSLGGSSSAGSEAAAAGTAAILVLTVLTILQVILGELIPKSLAIQYPERLALITALPMKWSADYILRPLILLLNGSGALILRLLGASYEGGHAHVHSPEEILILVKESHRGGLLDADERQLLGNLFRASTKRAEDIARPRNRIVSAAVDEPLEEVLRRVAASAYTRVPVFEGDIDHIVGFVHLRDLFNLYQSDRGADLRAILRPVPFVPETLPLGEVWSRLDENQCYLAIVFDEYGGTSGLITREDVIEEFVGEVQDEFDQERALILESGADRFGVRGDMLITDLNDRLDLKLPFDLAHTVGGLVVEELGRVPRVGDAVELAGVRLRVEAVEDLSVSQVDLTLLAEPTETSAESEA